MNRAARPAERELARLVAALGPMVEGGVVSDGAVLLPLAPHPDAPDAPHAPHDRYLLLRVSELPLPSSAAAALAAAGYRPVGAGLGRDSRADDGGRLEICAFDNDNDPWLARLAVRDQLRATPFAGEARPADFRDARRIAAAVRVRLRRVGLAPDLIALEVGSTRVGCSAGVQEEPVRGSASG